MSSRRSCLDRQPRRVRGSLFLRLGASDRGPRSQAYPDARQSCVDPGVYAALGRRWAPAMVTAGPRPGSLEAMDSPVLQVKDLVRRFGEHTAVDRVSFRIAAGRDVRTARAQRRRQDHDDLHDRRAARPPTRARWRCSASRWTGPGAQGARSAWCRRTSRCTRTSPAGRTCSSSGSCRTCAAQAARAGSPRCSRWWAWPTAPRTTSRTYSGGMKRRANIAVGLLHQPDAADPRRTDRRRRPAEPQQHPRGGGALGGAGMAVLVHHPLHGGGRAAVRPDRHHRSRPV